jgi:hypothetical protein
MEVEIPIEKTPLKDFTQEELFYNSELAANGPEGRRSKHEVLEYKMGTPCNTQRPAGREVPKYFPQGGTMVDIRDYYSQIQSAIGRLPKIRIKGSSAWETIRLSVHLTRHENEKGFVKEKKISQAESSKFSYRERGRFPLLVRLLPNGGTTEYRTVNSDEMINSGTSVCHPDWIYTPRAGISMSDLLELRSLHASSMISEKLSHAWVEVNAPGFCIGRGTGLAPHYDWEATLCAAEHKGTRRLPTKDKSERAGEGKFIHYSEEEWLSELEEHYPSKLANESRHSGWKPKGVATLVWTMYQDEYLREYLDLVFTDGMHVDQGWNQMTWYVTAVFFHYGDTRAKLIEIFTLWKPWRLTRLQFRTQGKEVHTSITRTHSWHKLLPMRVIAGLKYLQFGCGRGWVADELHDALERTDPLGSQFLAMEDDGTMSSVQWWKSLEKWARHIFKKSFPRSMPTNMGETMRQHNRSGMLNQANGASTGSYITVPPDNTPPEVKAELIESAPAFVKPAVQAVPVLNIQQEAMLLSPQVYLYTEGTGLKANSNSKQQRVIIVNSGDPPRDGLLIYGNKKPAFAKRWKYIRKVSELERKFWVQQACESSDPKWRDQVGVMADWGSWVAHAKLSSKKLKSRRCALKKSGERELWTADELAKAMEDVRILMATGFQKNENANDRVLWTVSFVVTNLGRYVLGSLDKYIGNVPGIDSGKSGLEKLLMHRELCRGLATDWCEKVRGAGMDPADYNKWHPVLSLALQMVVLAEEAVLRYKVTPADERDIDNRCISEDWTKACLLLGSLYLNAFLVTPDKTVVAVFLGLLSGHPDTSGQNGRMNSCERSMTDETYRTLMLIEQSDQLVTEAEDMGTGDDMVKKLMDVFLGAIHYMVAVSEGRPYGPSKQGWDRSVEFLRLLHGSTGLYGYLLRALGNFNSAPFEGREKDDMFAKLANLTSQLSTLYRREANPKSIELAYAVTKRDWGSARLRGDAGELQMEWTVPPKWWGASEVAGGLGLALHPLLITEWAVDVKRPDMSGLKSELARHVKGTGSADWAKGVANLLEEALGKDQSDRVLATITTGVHDLVLKPSATPGDWSACYRKMMQKLGEMPTDSAHSLGELQFLMVTAQGALVDCPRVTIVYGTPKMDKSACTNSWAFDIDDVGGQYSSIETPDQNWARISAGLAQLKQQLSKRAEPYLVLVGVDPRCATKLLRLGKLYNHHMVCVHLNVFERNVHQWGPTSEENGFTPGATPGRVFELDELSRWDALIWSEAKGVGIRVVNSPAEGVRVWIPAASIPVTVWTKYKDEISALVELGTSAFKEVCLSPKFSSHTRPLGRPSRQLPLGSAEITSSVLRVLNMDMTTLIEALMSGSNQFRDDRPNMDVNIAVGFGSSVLLWLDTFATAVCKAAANVVGPLVLSTARLIVSRLAFMQLLAQPDVSRADQEIVGYYGNLFVGLWAAWDEDLMCVVRY